jgi:hypothetical protein
MARITPHDVACGLLRDRCATASLRYPTERSAARLMATYNPSSAARSSNQVGGIV